MVEPTPVTTPAPAPAPAMNLTTVLNLLALINGVTPGIIALIATIKTPSGELIEVTLDKGESEFRKNMAVAAAWDLANPPL